MKQLTYIVFNYVDDFMSIDFEMHAWQSYNTLGNLLRDLGVNEAEDKAVPPTTKLEFLGVLYDLIAMTISLPADKLFELREELRRWMKKTMTKKKQLQSLVGKLQFAACCVRVGRVFVNRLFDAISIMTDDKWYRIEESIMKDLGWWLTFLKVYNGTSIMWLQQRMETNEFFATDACL